MISLLDAQGGFLVRQTYAIMIDMDYALMCGDGKGSYTGKKNLEVKVCIHSSPY